MIYDYAYLKDEVYKLTGIDLNAYKDSQMKRRIESLIKRHNLGDYGIFCDALKNDSDFLEEFKGYITINVSEFYRNPEQWEILRKQILPGLINEFGRELNIWSSACSTGEEPYSLAMILSDFVPIEKINILATDIDKSVLKTARMGEYNNKNLAKLPYTYRNTYFTRDNSKGTYFLNDDLKKRVVFKEADLIHDKYPLFMHLVVCRNVLIYMSEEAQAEIYRKFYDSLVPGGVLFIGTTEQIPAYKEIGYERITSFFFRKPLK